MTVAGHLTRSIHAVGASRAIPELLRSIFVAELLRPSSRFWIVSPWVSDIEVLDNSARQFSTLCPEWPAGPVRLVAILKALMERGTEVVLIVNTTSHNDDVIQKVTAIQSPMATHPRILRYEELHEKGLLGSTFMLNGSMNLTYNGVKVNDEYVTYSCDAAEVEQRRLELENRWREQLCS